MMLSAEFQCSIDHRSRNFHFISLVFVSLHCCNAITIGSYLRIRPSLKSFEISNWTWASCFFYEITLKLNQITLDDEPVQCNRCHFFWRNIAAIVSTSIANSVDKEKEKKKKNKRMVVKETIIYLERKFFNWREAPIWRNWMSTASPRRFISTSISISSFNQSTWLERQVSPQLFISVCYVNHGVMLAPMIIIVLATM